MQKNDEKREAIKVWLMYLPDWVIAMAFWLVPNHCRAEANRFRQLRSELEARRVQTFEKYK